MRRFKTFRNVRTLGKMLKEKELRDLKINIDIGDPSQQRHSGMADSPPVRTWVFSEKPTFQRYQSLYKKPLKEPKKVEIQKIKEPEVSVFKDVNEIKVVAELPGTVKEDIHIEVLGDILVIETQGEFQGRSTQYYKEVLLPFAVQAKMVDSSFVDNVLEVTLQRSKGAI